MAPPAPKPPPDVWSHPCSVCGAEVTGWSSDRTVREELVPDGIAASTVYVPRTYTVHPCGHTVPTIRIYSREPL